jgi:hypothetical protein
MTIPSRDANRFPLFDAELAELMLLVLIARGGRRGRWRRHAYCRLVIELTASRLVVCLPAFVLYLQHRGLPPPLATGFACCCFRIRQ